MLTLDSYTTLRLPLQAYIDQTGCLPDGHPLQQKCMADDVLQLTMPRRRYIDQVFDDLVARTGNEWHIDQTLKIYYRAPIATPAPWALTVADVLCNSEYRPTLTTSPEVYRNTQHLLNSNGLMSAKQSFYGDGTTTTFNLAMPIHEKPTVKVNGNQVSPSMVGLNGVDNNKSWYWN
jgi:hypothetical protein